MTVSTCRWPEYAVWTFSQTAMMQKM